MEELNLFWQQVLANKGAIWLVLTTTVTAAAAMAALTPNPKNNSWVAKIRRVIDFVGWNWGFAKNDKTGKSE